MTTDNTETAVFDVAAGADPLAIPANRIAPEPEAPAEPEQQVADPTGAAGAATPAESATTDVPASADPQPAGMSSEEFAELARRIFNTPAPDYAPAHVLDADAVESWKILCDQFHPEYDRDALGAFWRGFYDEWDKKVGAENAAKLQAEAQALSGATA